MANSEWQENLKLFVIHTALGDLYAEITREGISRLSTQIIDNNASVIDSQTRQIFAETKHQINEFLQGKRKIFDLPINPKGSEFQMLVWQELQNIPYGTTISYAEQALRLNSPQGIRAVASANAKNPLLIIIPCHRVVGSNGDLTGYAGGIAMKERLLNIEKGQLMLF